MIYADNATVRCAFADNALADLHAATRKMFDSYGYDSAKKILQTQLNRLEDLHRADEKNAQLSEETATQIDDFFAGDLGAMQDFIRDVKLTVRLKFNDSYQRAAKFFALQLEIARELAKQKE